MPSTLTTPPRLSYDLDMPALHVLFDETGRELWDAEKCAEFAGIEVRTFHGYVKRPTKDNPAPGPYGNVGRTMLWDADKVRAWQADRPGSPVPGHPLPGVPR